MAKEITKKMFLSIASVLLVIIVVVSIISISGDKIQYNILATDRVRLAPTYDDLGVVSDVIIKATVVPGKENKTIEADNGTIVFGYTMTQLKISDVFKGNVVEGGIITITEEYYTLANNRKVIYTQGNYMPVQENGEYIFFLKSYDELSPYAGMFFPIDLEYGKYSVNLANKIVSPESISASELEIVSYDVKYVEFATKVVEDYLR